MPAAWSVRCLRVFWVLGCWSSHRITSHTIESPLCYPARFPPPASSAPPTHPGHHPQQPAHTRTPPLAVPPCPAHARGLPQQEPARPARRPGRRRARRVGHLRRLVPRQPPRTRTLQNRPQN
ncbi:hypothetical protein B0H14DRAFT_2940937, partial [Mycena olivaceomarginata]